MDDLDFSFDDFYNLFSKSNSRCLINTNIIVEASPLSEMFYIDQVIIKMRINPVMTDNFLFKEILFSEYNDRDFFPVSYICKKDVRFKLCEFYNLDISPIMTYLNLNLLSLFDQYNIEKKGFYNQPAEKYISTYHPCLLYTSEAETV